MNDLPWMLNFKEIIMAQRPARSVRERDELTCKAQIRKVVDEMAKHILDRSYRIGFATEVYLDGKFWDELQNAAGYPPGRDRE